MSRTMRVLEVGTIVVGLSVATLAARQVVVQSDIRIGGGPLLGGPPIDNKPLTTGTGMMMGAVQDAATRRGIAGSMVTLSLPGFTPVQMLADAEGRFAFLNLPKGRFNLTATRPGYADGAFGRTRPSGPSTSIDLTDGERMGDVILPVWKFGSIAGTVIDENNDPIVGATVRVVRRTIVGGKRQLTQGPSDTTDDRGMYRIGSLEPGDYIVALPMTMPGGNSPLDRLLGGGGGAGGGASFSVAMTTSGGGTAMSTAIGDLLSPADASTAGVTEDGHLLIFPTQFYPAVTTPARATVLTLQSGEERAGIDMQLRPVRSARINGVVTSADGPAANISVTLSPADADDLVSPVGSLSTMTDGIGQFSFKGVPVGAYTLRATRSPNIRIQSDLGGGGGTMVMMRTVNVVSGPGGPLPTDPTLWAETNLTVGTNDLSDVSLSLRPGMKASGTVHFAGGSEKPAADKIASIAVTLEPADARSASASSTVRGRVEANGQFTTMGVPPGRYVLRAQNLPQGWALLSAAFGGQDISDEPVELTSGDAGGIVITLTDQPTELSGVVTAAAGNPDAGAAIIAFPTDSSAWIGRGTNPRRIRATRPGRDGTFSFANLPPGSYFVGAVPDVTAPDWQDPRFLETLSRSAARVQLGPGDKKSQNVQTAPVR